MKAVELNNNEFYHDGKVVHNLDMPNGKHIRFRAEDKDYNLTVTDPDGNNSQFPVPKDGDHHDYKIKGKKDQQYTFSLEDPDGVVPQMIVKVS